MQVCAEENGGKPLLITFLNVQLEELFPGLRDAGRRQKPRWELLGGRPWVPSITRPTPPPAEVELWAEATEWLASNTARTGVVYEGGNNVHVGKEVFVCLFVCL